MTCSDDEMENEELSTVRRQSVAEASKGWLLG